MTQVLDTFYAIDFDRCLSDNDKLDAIFDSLLNEQDSIDGEALRLDRETFEAGGGSFDVVDALQKQLSEYDLKLFLETFVERCQTKDLLLPGAKELIDKLKSNNKHFGIVSYGGDKWQSIKIHAAGLNYIPALITDHKRKGEIIESWQQSDKTFLVPVSLMVADENIAFKTVVLMDDKATAFSGLPAEARGYWVQSLFSPLLTSQKGSIPRNVRAVKGLEQVIQAESL